MAGGSTKITVNAGFRILAVHMKRSMHDALFNDFLSLESSVSALRRA